MEDGKFISSPCTEYPTSAVWFTLVAVLSLEICTFLTKDYIATTYFSFQTISLFSFLIISSFILSHMSPTYKIFMVWLLSRFLRLPQRNRRTKLLLSAGSGTYCHNNATSLCLYRIQALVSAPSSRSFHLLKNLLLSTRFSESHLSIFPQS